MNNIEQRLAVIFNNTQSNEELFFNCGVLVDYNKQTNSFKVKHGTFENSTEKAFNIIVGPSDFIYGNSNQMRIRNYNSDYSIDVFDNSDLDEDAGRILGHSKGPAAMAGTLLSVVRQRR